ncbi:MAG: DUF3822 family protein [Bacteroidales bacterium]
MQDAVSLVDKVALRNAERIHLSIQSNLSGLCFCLLNTETKEYFALQTCAYSPVVVDYNDLQKAVDSLLQNEELLNLPIEDVSCLFPSRCSSLIPTGFSEPAQFKFFLEQNTLIHELDEIHYLSIPSIEVDAVFTIPNPLAAKLSGKYRRLKFYHQIAPLLNISYQYVEQGYNTVLALNTYEDFVDILLIQEGQLLMYNTFEVDLSEDLIRCLLSLSHQYKLNNLLVKLLVINDAKKNLGNIPFLFPNLKILFPDPIGYSFSPYLQKHIVDQYSLLFSLYQCEL